MESENQAVEVDDETGTIENRSLHQFFEDLGKALKHHEDKVTRTIAKFQDPDKGKPSRKALGDAFQSLFDLLSTMNAIERCTMNHTQQIARSIDIRTRALTKVFVDRGLVTEQELEDKARSLLEAEVEAQEEQKNESVEEALAQAKDEASKR